MPKISRDSGHWLLLLLAIGALAEFYVFFVAALHNRLTPNGYRFIVLAAATMATAQIALGGFKFRTVHPYALAFGLLLFQPAASSIANAAGGRPFTVAFPLTTAGAAVFVLVSAYRGQRTGSNTSVEVTRGLREQALTAPATELGTELSPNTPFLVLMDMGYDKAVVSVVATQSGDASIYFSSGGGIIGGGAHENVRRAALNLVSESAKYLEGLTKANQFSSPANGNVRFFVRTPEAVLVSPDVSESRLGSGNDLLSPLFYAAQDVITQLRQQTPTPVEPLEKDRK